MSTTSKKRASVRSIGRGNGDESDASNMFESSRLSMQDEKDHLSSLNGRLASYIERVRQLEKENQTLTVQIKDIEVVEKKEKSNLSSRFEHEKARLRDLLEGKSSECAKLHVERDAAVAELSDLRNRLAKAEKEAKIADESRRQAQSLYDDANSRAARMGQEMKKLQDENKEVLRELAKLREQLDVARKTIEDESVLRASIQRKLDGALEDLDFQTGNLRAQLEEEHRKRQVEMTTVSRQLESQYHDKLKEKLEEGREMMSIELQKHREHFDSQYSNKFNMLQEQAERARDSEREARIQLREYELNASDSESKIAELEKKVNDLNRLLAGEQELRRAQLRDKDDKISDLTKEIANLMADYQEILAIKAQLDNELRSYQSLLETEETRLNLSRTVSPRVTTHTMTSTSSSTTGAGGVSSSAALTAGRGVKRRRATFGGPTDSDVYVHRHTSRMETNQTGPLKIAEVSQTGEFVRLVNTTDEDAAIGGWMIKVQGGGREVSYKFTSKATVKAGAEVTIWSQNTGHTNKPPNEIVMKSQSWPASTSPEAKILNAEGERVAWQELVTGDFTEMSGSGDPNERCSIM